MHVTYMIERGKPWWRGPIAGDSPVALAVSDWDGVHRSHAALARQTAKIAKQVGGQAVALLPWPSPAGDDNQPATCLTTLEERIARLDALGCFETLLIVPVLAEARETEAAFAWLRSLGEVVTLLGEPDATGAVTHVWPAGLADVARAAGVAVEQGPWSKKPGDLCERIREHIAHGRMREATMELGYTYTVAGEVVGGDRRGRLLGFPTANLRLDPSKLVPGNGIYAGWVRLPSDDAYWPAAVSVGVRPTFGEGLHQQIEAHLLDATMDLYGLHLRLEFLHYLRAELRFDSFADLIQQMGYDREQARGILRGDAESRSEYHKVKVAREAFRV